MIFKFNNGQGAILCSKCRKILKSGNEIPDYVWTNLKNGSINDLPDMYCEECKKLIK